MAANFAFGNGHQIRLLSTMFGNENVEYNTCSWINMFSVVESLSETLGEVMAANLAFGNAARRRIKNNFLLCVCV